MRGGCVPHSSSRAAGAAEDFADLGFPGDVGVGQKIVHAELGAAELEAAQEGGHFAAVVLADGWGVDLEAGVGFHVLEGDGTGEGEVGFGAVEDLDDDELVAGVAEVLEGQEEAVGIVEEVGDEDDQAAAGDFVGQVMEGIGDVGFAGGFDLFEFFEDLVEVAGAAALGDFQGDVPVEDGEADEILLVGSMKAREAARTAAYSNLETWPVSKEFLIFDF